jgi:DNA-binding transcriptional LysR family regulator
MDTSSRSWDMTLMVLAEKRRGRAPRAAAPPARQSEAREPARKVTKEPARSPAPRSGSARGLPPLDPYEMLVFAALARAGGVRGAAALLGVPRSTVSRRLAQLEATVSAPLVVRSARRFELTDLGVAFAARCEQLEDLLRGSEDLVQQATAEASGTLRVAASPLLGEEVLPDVIAELVRRHPRLRIELRMSADYVDLRKGDVDVAIRTGPLEDASDLFTTSLGTSVTGHYVSPSYAEARGVPATPAELSAHDCIIVGRRPRTTWIFRGSGRDDGVTIEPRVRVDSFRVARALAAQGAGVVRFARMFAAPLLATGELIPVLDRYWPRVTLHAVHARGNPPPPKVRVFVALAREAVRRALAAENDGQG